MVKEIVHIQIGQSGNQIGSNFFNHLLGEHFLGLDGQYEGDQSEPSLDKFQTFYNETKKNKYHPRALLIGSDPNNIGQVLTGKDLEIYIYNYQNQDRSHFRTIWPLFYYNHSLEYGEQIIESIRKETEKCNSLQGFQIVHSLGGGSGSGLCSYILKELQDEYPDRRKSTFSIFPSEKVENFFYEQYNFILSLPFLIDFADQVVCIDNEGVYNISSDYWKSTNLYYEHLNFLISLIMSNFTCTLRFPDQINSDLNKMIVNLNPFPKYHFLVSNFYPITSQLASHPIIHLNDFTSNLFNDKNWFAACDPNNSVYLSASALFRVHFRPNDVLNEMKKIQIPKIPNFKISICGNQLFHISTSVFANTTSVKDIFKRIYSQFHKYYEKRCFIHKFLFEGVEFEEFEESSNCVKDLICGYETIQINS